MSDKIQTHPERLPKGWTPKTYYVVTLRLGALEWARLQLPETAEILAVEEHKADD